MNRLDELKRFYAAMESLESILGGKRKLANCDGRMSWPNKGIYFFFEACENRDHSGQGMRVVRVGTHAITETSRTTLWKRLYQHKGNSTNGGGNHRGSIFRLLVGEALQRPRNGGRICQSWAKGSSAAANIRQGELVFEQEVSQYLGNNMPFLWVNVPCRHQRQEIEAYCIRLLTNSGAPERLDPPSENWLGGMSPRAIIRASGLWNQNHADRNWTEPPVGQPTPVDLFTELIQRMPRKP